MQRPGMENVPVALRHSSGLEWLQPCESDRDPGSGVREEMGDQTKQVV